MVREYERRGAYQLGGNSVLTVMPLPPEVGRKKVGITASEYIMFCNFQGVLYWRDTATWTVWENIHGLQS